ncbi:MAG: ferritin [Actinomycetota bacterium]
MGWSRNIEDAMNAQLGFELGSAYTYLSMAAYCEAESLPGFAHWMKLQYHEELEHAERFFTFIIDRGGRVRLEGIDKPKTDFATPLEIFESSLENERSVTEAINELYTLTTKEQDYASQAFLNWFVTEQVEEEKMVTEIIDALKRAGQTGEALLLLDRELGRRPPEKG